MSEMIERVAKAIYASEGERPAWDSDMCSEGAKRYSRLAAKAAIEAMREPTDAMLQNTVNEDGRTRVLDFTEVSERHKSFLMPRYCWRAMIDAALNLPR